MQLRETSRSQRDIDMAVMIDVVFLILIFFLLATTVRPFAAQGIKPATTQLRHDGKRATAPLLIDATGKVHMNGKIIDTESLAEELRLKATELGDKELHVVADRGLAANKLIPVLEEARSSGISNVRLVTVRGR